jgi:hypothetical protein
VAVRPNVEGLISSGLANVYWNIKKN